MSFNKLILSLILSFLFLVSSTTTVLADKICPDNFADVNGTYVRKNNQGVIVQRRKVTGFKSYVLIEKIDLEDGSVIGSRSAVWTNAGPLCFSFANKGSQRLKVNTRGNTPPFNLSEEVNDKDCNVIKTFTWEKESS